MPTKMIVYGPNDLTRLLKANDVTTIFRMESELTIDNKGNITGIIAYPVDVNFNEITNAGSNFRIKGCPYPPDCNNIS